MFRACHLPCPNPQSQNACDAQGLQTGTVAQSITICESDVAQTQIAVGSAAGAVG